MPLSPEWLDPRVGEGVADAASLARFDGAPKDFWGRYLGVVQKLTGAGSVMLFFKPAPDVPWKRAAEVRNAPSGKLIALAGQLPSAVDDIAAHAAEHDGCALAPRELFAHADLPPDAADLAILAVTPALSSTDELCLIVATVAKLGESEAAEALIRLKLVAAVPDTYQRNMGGQRAGDDVKKIATALDLNVLVNKADRFVAAGLSLCNGAASNLACDRVSLGWQEGGLVKLRAISRTEKFDRKMEAAQALEAAMDEALDQDDEIVWPAQDSASTIARDHGRFSESQNIAHVMSVPLREDGRPIGVITCERAGEAFTETELAQIRLAADLTAPRLIDLKHRDRWIGARAASAFREKAAGLLGPTHTWTKIAALLTMITLAVLIFVKVPHRVEADFVLRSDEVSYIAAPMAGYIAEVHVRAGDQIAAGQPLLALDRTQLDLERSSAEADLARFQRETEKARAERKLAEMRVAESQAEQARVRLQLVEHRLAQSSLVSPFDAYVVEGDQRDRIGAPVKEGDVLFRLARIDNLHVEAKVNERDVLRLLEDATGEISFVSRPSETFDIAVENILPAAVPDPAGNTFLVRCSLAGESQSWARPGMSGVCKLNAEKRSLGYIFTHRTVDFLRMYFWW